MTGRLHKTADTESASGRPGAGAPRQRTAVLVAFAPLAVIVALFLWGLGQRALADHRRPDGILSRQEATRLALKVCGELTGSPSRVRDATLQSAFSRQRGALVQEWGMLCETGAGEYLLRMNATTGRVYAINHLTGQSEPSSAVSERAADATDRPLLTRQEAEAEARRYLGLLGVSTRDMKPISEEADEGDTPEQWNFTFQREVPGMGPRLLKISVNGKNGNLEDAWNPVYAL
jgi:hypothetical protein